MGEWIKKFSQSNLKLEMSTNNIYQLSIKIFILAFLVTCFFNEKTISQCKPEVLCFTSSEELYYDVIYNWGFIWVEAGKVEFKTRKEVLEGKPVYHFSGFGTSLKKHDWFFKVRDYYDSWAELEDLKPLKHIRNTSEGDYQVDNKYSFDYKTNKIYTNSWNTNKARVQDTFQIKPCIYDIMTAVYYARTIDLSKYQNKQKIPMTLIVDNEIHNLYGRFLGKETLKTKDKAKINCLKFSILLVEGTMFKGGENLTIWLSDDENRVPILVEAKILVGSVKAIFNNAKNLKVPKSYKPDVD
jgi:hypothetical protein